MSNYNNFDTANQSQIDETIIDIAGDFEPEVPDFEAPQQQPHADAQQDDQPWNGCGDEPVSRQALQYKAFPVDQLPEPLASFVVNAAASIGCDPAFLAMPLLSMLGSAIGNSRWVEVKAGWQEKPILWCALVAESGTAKSPALRLIKKPAVERQRILIEQNIENQKAHAIEKLKYETELARWKKKGDGDPPLEPEQKPWVQIVANDATIEAILSLLGDNYRGLFLPEDELTTFFGGFGRYTGSAAADEATWLKLYGAESFTINRKTGQRHLSVRNGSVCICGNITPAVASRAMNQERFETGLVARFLLSMPPDRLVQWTDATVSKEDEERFADIYNRLQSLQPTSDELGDEIPVICTLATAAKKLFIQFYDQNKIEMHELHGKHRSLLSKLEAVAVRFALILNFCRWASTDQPSHEYLEIDGETMADAIELVNWFKHEIPRVYALLEDQAQQEDCQATVTMIKAMGGAITARELMRKQQYKFKTSQQAEVELNKLRDNGFGDWQQSEIPETGGRPSREFVLFRNDTMT